LRLHRSLVGAGINSHFLTLENQDFHPQVNELVLGRSRFKKFLSKSTVILGNKLFTNTYFTLFSTPVLTPSKLNKLGFDENTVLHIHNWFNLLNVHQIERLLRAGFRLIITLHDQRFFTGGCHYSLGCEGFIKRCGKCPLLPNPSLNYVIRRNHKNLFEMVAKHNNQIVFLAPSKWMFSEALRSSILKNSRVIFLPNLHSEFENELNHLEKYPRMDRKEIFSVGVASMDSSSPLKGSDFILDIMEKLRFEKVNFQLKQLSQYSNTREGYLNFWREIDCLLVLSRADNSPNVIHESKIARVPIIGTNIGGIPELLNQNFDFIFENDQNLVKNVSEAIVKISKSDLTMPKEIGLRYRSPDSKGSIDQFLELYSEFN